MILFPQSTKTDEHPRRDAMLRFAWRLRFTLTLLGCLASRSDASGLYSVTDLNDPHGSLFDNIQINNQGQVVGRWLDNSGLPSSREHPFLYDPQAGGKVTLLGITPPSGQ